MSHVSGQSGAGRLGRRYLAAVVGTLVVALMLASSSQATQLGATCSTFGTILANAQPGDTIVLTGLCTGADDSFTLPSTAGLTIEGAATGTNGFDGGGNTTSALSSVQTQSLDGLTLENLTFENYTGEAVYESNYENGVSLTEPFVIASDTFTGNAPGGALAIQNDVSNGSCQVSGPQITVENSTFSQNTSQANGGALQIDDYCNSADGSVPITVSGNTFSDDAISSTQYYGTAGGALEINGGLAILDVTQQDNAFLDDSVSSSASGATLAGGGEATIGANITSTGDSFIGDSLGGPTVAGDWSWGAGLATFGGGQCTNPSGSVSTFTNLVAAGNSIGAPTGTATAADTLGAGIYAGCNYGAAGGGDYDLTLVDSTVSGNSVAGSPGDGGVAGVDGESADQLHLENTIVAGDTGGSEIGGFGTTAGANATATYSDVCAVASSTTPFTGTGNICAAPALVSATSGDIHETAASPTIDAGSNALVTSGVTTDFYGNPRIHGSAVDMGAAEFNVAASVTTTTTTATASTVTPTPSVTTPSSTTTTAPTTTTTPIQSPSSTCPVATGSLTSTGLGRITIGMSRARARRAYPTRVSGRGDSNEDVFCLSPGVIRVAYASTKLVAKVAPKLAGRVIWASTANPHYGVDGIRPGSTLAMARTRLVVGNVTVIGLNRWYFAHGSGISLLLKVRGGVVDEIGVADATLTEGLAAQARFLREL